MQMRWRRPLIGDRVTVQDCEMYFYLPDGLPHGSRAILVGYDSGRYIVRALGRDWNIPMQCLVHNEEFEIGGRWLPATDYQARKQLTKSEKAEW
jgi:hypothetical protein